LTATSLSFVLNFISKVMARKIVYELKGEYSKEEIRRHKHEQNQKKAKTYLLITSSRYWFNVFSSRPYLYKLHLLLFRAKRIYKGDIELIDIMFDKFKAIRDQNWKLAAAMRDREVQREQTLKQKLNIKKIDASYNTIKNGKLNLGIFHIEKRSKKN